jgi:hypothetical protein
MEMQKLSFSPDAIVETESFNGDQFAAHRIFMKGIDDQYGFLGNHNGW